MKKIAIILITLLSAGAVQAKEYPEVTLGKLLSKTQLESLNVSKMTATQKETLRMALINSYMSGFESGKEKGIELAVEYQQKQSAPSGTIESQIDGEFEGFEGETIIKLMNGQIWQQTEYWYHYHYSYMPKVIIFRSGGGYKIKVDGIDKAIGVTLLN